MANIFMLTNEPVSKELSDIIQKLDNNEKVTLEDFKDIPEIVFGRNCATKGTDTTQIKGRESLDKKITFEMLQYGSYTTEKDNKEYFEGLVYQDKRLDIVMGLPASGKSSTLCNDLSKQQHSRIIDCDEVKKKFPEYNNGWGADLVHHESKQIADEIFRESLKNEENMILQKVGANPNSIKKYIDTAHSFGYKVNIHYVELPQNKAFARLLNRFIEEGRFYEPEIIFKQDDNLQESYETLKEYCDGFSKWDNNVEKGCPPVLVETSLENIRKLDETRVFNNEPRQTDPLSDKEEIILEEDEFTK